MTDERFESELDDLAAMMRDLRLIKDIGERKWLRAEIRIHFNSLLRKC